MLKVIFCSLVLIHEEVSHFKEKKAKMEKRVSDALGKLPDLFEGKKILDEPVISSGPQSLEEEILLKGLNI
jgi:hypothetical protein